MLKLRAAALQPSRLQTYYFCHRCGAKLTEEHRRLCADCRITPRKDLTPGERKVVELVHQAKLNKEIAFELGMAEGSIKEYLVRIFRKVGARNRVELALWAERSVDFNQQPEHIASELI